LALFGFPLLVRCWDRRLPRALALHALALLAVMAVAVGARYAAGEGRAIQSVGGVGEIAPRLIGSLLLGPLRSLAGMFYGPVKAIPIWDLETVLLFGATAACAGLFLAIVATREFRPDKHVWGSAEYRRPLQITAAGALMLILGYGLAFTHFPPNALVGRGTSVHLGATLGMAVLAAGVAWIFLVLRPTLAAGLLGAYLALAVGYYVTIERDFLHAWQLQRSFWQQVAACCSDLQDGTVLIYELSPADEPTFIFANSWADPLVLARTFDFPSNWTNPPRLFSLTEWAERVEPEGDHLRWWVPGASWDEHWEMLPQDNVILLRRTPDGTLSRVTGSLTVAGQLLRLKTPSPPGSWPAAPLHDRLLRP
jgi:hypothetical protein